MHGCPSFDRNLTCSANQRFRPETLELSFRVPGTARFSSIFLWSFQSWFCCKRITPGIPSNFLGCVSRSDGVTFLVFDLLQNTTSPRLLTNS